MTTRSVDGSQRIAAKIFGLAYLPSFVLVVAVNFGILMPLIDGVDPAQAAKNILASAWCAVCTFTFLISPGFSKVVNLWAFDTPMALFEIALSLLLLFRGLRPSGHATDHL